MDTADPTEIIEVQSTQNQTTRRKFWCFTLFYTCIGVDVVFPDGLPSAVSYLVFQQELCPTTERTHLQGYVRFASALRFNQAKTEVQGLFSTKSSPRLAFCEAGFTANYRYCTKEDTRVPGTQFIELGDRPNSNRGLGVKKTSATPRIREAILSRKTPLQALMCETDSDIWSYATRYARTWNSLLGELLPQRSREIDPTVIIYYGVPRSGKTKLAHDAYPDAYIKPTGKWWDRYKQQSAVVYDDFDGSFMSFGDWKQITDRYPMDIEIKGGCLPIMATTHIITTNVHPTEWWSLKVLGKWGLEALYGRVSYILYFDGESPPRKLTVPEFRAEFPSSGREVHSDL